jgi:hypothetical protein
MGIRKRINPKTLDGHLHVWLEHLSVVQKLKNSGVLSMWQELDSLENAIKRLVINSRTHDIVNWLWTEEDIYQEEDDIDGLYRLPSVDIAGYFGLENGHRDLEKFFKKNGCKIPIVWDTERSAWYPLFRTREDAIACIKFVNELFDKHYNIPT